MNKKTGQVIEIPKGVRDLPSVKQAQFPEVYIKACESLATCNRIDECKEWADKSAAVASYAKQAQDETMLNLAMRIKARAIRRCGELLKAIDAMPPKESGALKGRGGTTPTSPRKQAAREAGLSDDQRKQAIRVANVLPEEFEKAVESEPPATVTALAEKGKQKQDDELTRPKPPGFEEATRILGNLRRAAEKWPEVDPKFAIGGMQDKEIEQLEGWLKITDEWLNALKAALKKRRG